MNQKGIISLAFLAVFISIAVTVPSVRADIGGRTTIKCMQGNTSVSCESTRQNFNDRNVVAGSTVEASFFEAFIDAVQLLDKIYQVVKNIVAENYAGAVWEMYGAYDEALQLGDSAGDKKSVQQAYVSLDQNAPYTTVTLTFQVWSDDDTFGDLKVAAPIVRYDLAPAIPGTLKRSAGGVIPAVSVGPITGGRGQRSGLVSVTFSPKNMPLGRYPIAFSAQEANCSICLGIVHVIYVSVYKTCRLTPNSGCDILSRQWASLQSELLSQKASLYPLFADFRRREQARIRYCGTPNINRTPPVGCDGINDDRINEGSCPDLAVGLSSSACEQARQIFDRIGEIEDQMELVAARIFEQKCCHEVVNPGGGTGVPSKDLNITPKADQPPGKHHDRHPKQQGKPKYEDAR
jgi:hypothetical protein